MPSGLPNWCVAGWSGPASFRRNRCVNCANCCATGASWWRRRRPNATGCRSCWRPANIKLGSVATDVFGVSGRAILRALLDDTASPEEMAELARGRLRSKRVELAHSLKGQVEDYHRFLLSMQLRRVEDTEQYIEQLDQRIAEKLEPYQSAMALLMQIPGVDWVVAAVLIAEIGTDMSVFISVYHLAAWSGLCPGSHERAGKRRNVSVRKGNM